MSHYLLQKAFGPTPSFQNLMQEPPLSFRLGAASDGTVGQYGSVPSRASQVHHEHACLVLASMLLATIEYRLQPPH
jgi:hypothetical protein